DPPGGAYLMMASDATWRSRYADAIETQINNWNADEIAGWLETWSAQIADAVSADSRKWATVDEFHAAIDAAGDAIRNRPAYLQSFVRCERGAASDATDGDGDGFTW